VTVAVVVLVCRTSDDVGYTAAFLLSPLSRAVTGTTLYVDNGLSIMGMALDSVSMQKDDAPQQ
jgi:enoyl-[acyl-carrier protein] reductase I